MAALPDPILVVGAARSGTSLVAGILRTCGAFGGKLSERQVENTTISNWLVSAYLREIGADQKGQHPLPDFHNLPPADNWRRRVEGAIRLHGYKDGSAWFYKDVRTCLIWPIWMRAFPNATWIIVRREPADIIGSILATPSKKAFSAFEDWKRWLAHYESCFSAIKQTCNTRELQTQPLIDGDFKELETVFHWAGLCFSEDAVKGFINPSLWVSSNASGTKGT